MRKCNQTLRPVHPFYVLLHTKIKMKYDIRIHIAGTVQLAYNERCQSLMDYLRKVDYEQENT